MSAISCYPLPLALPVVWASERNRWTFGPASEPRFIPPSNPSNSIEDLTQAKAGSRYIRRDQVFDLYDAILFANYQGRVLNVEMTISWNVAGITDPKDVNRAFNVFRDRFRQFLAHRKCPALYYAVFENSKRMKLHTHIAAHVPDEHLPVFRDWWRSIESEYPKGQSGTKMFVVRTRKRTPIHSQWRWFQYLMKGMDPKLRSAEKGPGVKDANSLAYVWRRETGIVEVQRVRIARSLGPKARRKNGYAPFQSLTDVDLGKRYGDFEFQRGRMLRGEIRMSLDDPNDC